MKRKWRKRSLNDVLINIQQDFDEDKSKKRKNVVSEVKREQVPHIESDLEEKEEEQNEFFKAHKCANCMSQPFRNKDRRLRIICTRPIFKQNRYGNWIPSCKEKGEIPLESCITYLKYREKKNQAKEEKSDIDSLKTKIKEQSKELTRYRDKEADQTQRTLESMQKGESIVCRLKSHYVIPLWKCFEIQDEQKEIPQHFTSPNERCPCGHFIHLEKLEMKKYEKTETLPFIDSEIRKQYL